MNKFDKKYLEILKCPETGADLFYDEKENILFTKGRQNIYQVITGIPRLISSKNDA